MVSGISRGLMGQHSQLPLIIQSVAQKSSSSPAIVCAQNLRHNGYNARKMVNPPPKAELAPPPKGRDWADFLANAPPDSTSEISDLWISVGDNRVVRLPDIFLYCDSKECDGFRFFSHESGVLYVSEKAWSFDFLHYRCRNCREKEKSFAVAVASGGSSGVGVALKVGEIPPFGPSTPARVLTLIGEDRELFLQGRRAENRGMGIGAFAYYRRVVENQKTRIIHEISKVAAKLGANSNVLAEFEAAAKETQFSKALEQIKHGIPQTLLIDDQHNPLNLLHTALSQGLHADTDQECLAIAQAIRVVLTELAERISEALKKKEELTTAVTKLLSRKSPKLPT